MGEGTTCEGCGHLAGRHRGVAPEIDMFYDGVCICMVLAARVRPADSQVCRGKYYEGALDGYAALAHGKGALGHGA